LNQFPVTAQYWPRSSCTNYKTHFVQSMRKLHLFSLVMEDEVYQCRHRSY